MFVFLHSLIIIVQLLLVWKRLTFQCQNSCVKTTNTSMNLMYVQCNNLNKFLARNVHYHRSFVSKHLEINFQHQWHQQCSKYCATTPSIIFNIVHCPLNCTLQLKHSCSLDTLGNVTYHYTTNLLRKPSVYSSSNPPDVEQHCVRSFRRS